jgi:hypothetical protein
MAEEKSAGQGESDFPDAKGMQRWLESEIADIQKAADLRIRDATAIVSEYTQGRISAEEAERRSYAYANRWGDALPGVMSTRGLTDEEILRKLDQARAKEGLLDKHVLGRRQGGAPETSR